MAGFGGRDQGKESGSKAGGKDQGRDPGKSSGSDKTGLRGAGSISSINGSLGLRADIKSKAKQNGLTEGDLQKSATNWADRVTDYQGKYDSFFDSVGNYGANKLGFREQYSPYDPMNKTTKAPWGWDPLQSLATAGGLFGGIPGSIANMGYSVAQMAGYNPPTIGMGTDVFGQDQPGSTFDGTQGGSFGGGFNGGGNGSGYGGNQGNGHPSNGSAFTPQTPVVKPIFAPQAQPPAIAGPMQAPQLPKPKPIFNFASVPGGKPYGVNIMGPFS